MISKKVHPSSPKLSASYKWALPPVDMFASNSKLNSGKVITPTMSKMARVLVYKPKPAESVAVLPSSIKAGNTTPSNLIGDFITANKPAIIIAAVVAGALYLAG